MKQPGKFCEYCVPQNHTVVEVSTHLSDDGWNTTECSRLSTVEFNCSYWPSFKMLHHFCDEILMTKPQSTTQDLIYGARSDLP